MCDGPIRNRGGRVFSGRTGVAIVGLVDSLPGKGRRRGEANLGGGLLLRNAALLLAPALPLLDLLLASALLPLLLLQLLQLLLVLALLLLALLLLDALKLLPFWGGGRGGGG